VLLLIVFKYHTIEAPDYYTTTYAAPNCITKGPVYTVHHGSVVLHHQITEVLTATYAAPPSEPRLTKSLEYYTTTYVAPAYYIVFPKYYTTKAPVYYTTTCAASTHFIETSSITLLQLLHRCLNLLHHQSG
jgi:hypothetical protein